MQLSIAGTKLLFLQEKTVVHQRQRIENIKFVLLSEDESVLYKLVKTLGETSLFY